MIEQHLNEQCHHLLVIEKANVDLCQYLFARLEEIKIYIYKLRISI